MEDFRNIAALVSVREGTGPANRSAGTTNGTGINRYTLNNPMSCVLRLACGAATGAPSARTVDARLQSSDTLGGTYADVTGAAVTQLTADNTASQVAINLSGAKQFVRVVEVVGFTGGTSPAIPVVAELIFGGADRLPAP